MINKLINDKADCTGCSACFAVCPAQCITMVADNYSFSYPRVDYTRCIKCKLCIKTCPIQNKPIGQMLDAYAIYHTNADIRKESASGGFFYALASTIIADKQGIVFGARFDEGMNVIHTYTSTLEGIVPFMGSKYVNSNLQSSFKQTKQFLEDDIYVLFSGLPCQIAGLKAFLKKDYDTLITMDVFCYGVASHHLFSKYLNESSHHQEIINFKFRSKKISWEEYGTKVIYANNPDEFRHHLEDDFMYMYLNHYMYQPACYKCRFKSKNKVSDFFVGDYWGVQNYHPSMYDTNGVSAVFVNTEKGRDYFKHICNQFKVEVSNYDNILANNIALNQSVLKPKKNTITKLLITYFKLTWVVKFLKSFNNQ